MTRHPRTSAAHSPLPGLLAALAVTTGAFLPPPAAAAPYYTTPCRDLNNDRIEDFLMDTPETTVDMYVVFEAATWDPVTARATVQSILDNRHSSAVIVYVGRWSPYVFLKQVKFGTPKETPLELLDILDRPHVVGLRAYERFPLNTRRIDDEMEPQPIGGHLLPGQDGSDPGHPGDPSTGATPRAVGTPAPAPQPLPTLPRLLTYFVDSGINGTGQYWGIDAAKDDPLLPKQAHDPGDISPNAHGTFVQHVAAATLRKEAPGGVPFAAWADVRVGVGPAAETTTLELTRGFDAIVAHIEEERQMGHLFRPVVNVSYDTDGPIANHDIIYPAPGGPLDPRAADASLTPSSRAARGSNPRPATAAPYGGPPCDTPLFDNVFHLLADVYDGILVIGAGNDGRNAAYVINEVGLSSHSTFVVAAVDPVTGKPSDYSCFGNAPGGQPQNGHPDVAALGRTRAEGFDYDLEGTSISTAFCSGEIAAALARSPHLGADQLRAQLISKGSSLPDTGPRWYGETHIHVPGDRQAVAGAGFGAPERRPTLIFPGSGERLTVVAGRDAGPSVRIFSVTGRLVRTLADRDLSPGRHEVAFDGRGSDGSPLPAGLYFVRVADPAGTSVTKLLVRR